MRRPGSSPVRRNALRTAGLATAVVAACLGAALTATDLLVSRSLTAAVDQRLQDWLRDASAATTPPATEPAPDNDFDEPLLYWTRLTDGSCRPTGSAPSLSPALCSTESATTAEIAGIPFRLMGGPVASGAHLVVGAADAVVRATQGRWEVTNLAGGGVRFGVSWPPARRGGEATGLRGPAAPPRPIASTPGRGADEESANAGGDGDH